MQTAISSPELLAPAGDWECLRAAVANGADAVYFGLDQFNARHRATNFSLEDLPEVTGYLHRHNTKGFVTFNTLIFSDELPAAIGYIRRIAAAGVDAVIVQDLGLATLIREIAPTLHVHGSTQMTLTEPRGIEFVRKLGVQRVVLARELSINDIAKITQATDMPLEVFIHGALCVAYSGQCLTSEALGGRSANRGQCAQACRLPYELVVDGATRELGDVAYLLSPRDLAAHDLIGELTNLGVASFKIEGRLKSAHYVAATTQTYRAAVDAAVQHKPFLLSAPQRHDLELVYSRGLSTGFLAGVNHQALVHGLFPKSRGRRIGTVIDTTARGFLIETDSFEVPLKNGDGVVFDEGHPDEKEMGGRVYGIEPRGPGVWFVDLGRMGPKQSDVTLNSTVWHTDDPALKKRLEQSYAKDRVVRRVKVTAEVRAHVGGLLTIRLSDGAHEGSATSSFVLQPAENYPVTEQSARNQIDKLRDTPFVLSAFALDTDGKTAVPAALWNELRRQVVADLIARRERATAHGVLLPLPPSEGGLAVESVSVTEALLTPTLSQGEREQEAKLHVLARTLDQVEALASLPAEQRPATIYCDFEDVRRHKAAVDIGRRTGVPIGLATIRIQKPGEEGWLKQLLDCEPDLVIVRSLAALSYMQEFAPQLPLVGDYSLNIANERTAGIFADVGLVRVVPSYDLNWRQMAAMLERAPDVSFECVVHQHMPMFHMEHCVFAHTLSEGKDYRDCGRPCETHLVDLRDRVGQPHPLIPDAGCRNTVYNAQAQSAADYLPRMIGAGVRDFRVELLRDSPNVALERVAHYADLIAGRAKPQSGRSLQVLSQLGVTRGTFERE